MIEVNNLTLKYSNNKGIFDLNFKINKGEVVGYLGPNGAGKTTTIRALLGFMKANIGNCLINDMDCFDKAANIQNKLGYLPGEGEFIDGMTGEEFLNFICLMRKMTDFTRKDELIDIFDLDIKGRIKKFSKGMKQKLGIITAFMNNPDILILDEPTSGLDPLMQNKFVELVLEEKKKGKTILMSSHIFEEIEKTCDRVIIIKEGKIVVQSNIVELTASQIRKYVIKLNSINELINSLTVAGFNTDLIAQNTTEVSVTVDRLDEFVKILSKYSLSDFNVKSQTLEDIFMKFYEGGF